MKVRSDRIERRRRKVVGSGRLTAEELAIAQELLNRLQQALTYAGR